MGRPCTLGALRSFIPPIRPTWGILTALVAQVASSRSRGTGPSSSSNWLSSPTFAGVTGSLNVTHVAFAVSVYDESFERLDKARARAMGSGAFDPNEAFLPTIVPAPRGVPVSGDTPATVLPSVTVGDDDVPLGGRGQGAEG